MDRDPLYVAIMAELLRARLSELEEHLKSRYKDAAHAVLPRREKVLAIVEESHALAVEAIKRMQPGPRDAGPRADAAGARPPHGLVVESTSPAQGGPHA